MTNATPALSIVINNYNYAQFLAEALDGALAQLADGDEIIVVDDGSTDESPALLERYASSHGVQVIRQENQGQLKAVCAGLLAANADVVVLLDSDDCLLPGYLDRLRGIYSEHTDIDYVFVRPQPFGEDNTAAADVARHLDNMALTPGPVGVTRWAARLFQEYAGVPTSGNSLRRSLAQATVPLLQRLGEPLPLAPGLARWLGVSTTESKRPGQSADGALVRCTSIVGARKYYDDSYGFRYRIHSDNKYARSSRLGRRYLRRLRKQQFSLLAAELPDVARRPTVEELVDEVEQRALPQKSVRRTMMKLLYSRYILSSQGTLPEKMRALRRVMRI